jgi:hypothetical protein
MGTHHTIFEHHSTQKGQDNFNWMDSKALVPDNEPVPLAVVVWNIGEFDMGSISRASESP